MRVRIVAEEHKDVLAVPREAVVLNENGDHVVAIVTGETAVHRTVKTGLEENGLMEIQSAGMSRRRGGGDAGGLRPARHATDPA